MEEKSKKNIIVGGALLSLGVIFLINNFVRVSDFDWSFVWKLWPFVLILFGAYYLVTDKKVKIASLVLISVILAVSLFAASITFRHFKLVKKDGNEDLFKPTGIKENFDKNIKNASLLFRSSTGEFTLKDTSKELINAEATITYGKYNLEKDIDGDKADLSLIMDREKFILRPSKSENIVNLQLNPDPLWEFTFDINAGKADFDLSNFRVDKARVDADATSMAIKIGDRHSDVNLNIDSNTSSLEISIPKNTGCKIIAKTTLSDKDFEGFKELDDKTFQTENFDNAQNKITINLEALTSNVKVLKY